MSGADVLSVFNLYGLRENAYLFKMLLQVVKCKNLDQVPM